MDSNSKVRKTAATSPSTTGTSPKGMQKFYTKIRHKIEDIPPKITAKLNKTSSPKPCPEPVKPVAPPRSGRKNQNKLKNSVEGSAAKSMDNSHTQSSSSRFSSPSYENLSRVSSNPNGYPDSDEECRLSLNDSNQSLEDEIFEELEKVAHDEAKLKAVLKNFDKILAEFNEKTMATSTPALKLNSGPSSDSQITKIQDKHKQKTEKSDGQGHKPLQKSKTCSIIESRCILKKSISDPTETLSDESKSLCGELSHFSAFQVTKSLWNLQDFEAFAKSGKKLEKFECKLPILKTAYNTYKVGKTASSPPSIKSPKKYEESPHKRNNLPKSKSVWELSESSQSTPINQHTPCTRTYSGSKIPVMKTSSQKMAICGRSNSFCDQVTPTAKLSPTPATVKVIQVGKVLPTPKRNPQQKSTTVNKIVKNLNEISATNKALTKSTMALSKISTNVSSSAKKRFITPATSTPHSLHKVGISAVKASSALSSLPMKSTIKSANSELSLNHLKPPKMASPKINTGLSPPKRQPSDMLLNKCLEKGHALLKKVEAFGSVTKLEKENSSSQLDSKSLIRRDVILTTQKSHPPPQPARRISSAPVNCTSTSEQSSLSTSSHPPENKKSKSKGHNQNYTVVIVNKKSRDSHQIHQEVSPKGGSPEIDEDVVDSCILPRQETIKPSSRDILYATESTVKFPRLESCKIIPPILGNPSQQHAELLVSVKAMQQPLRVHQDSMLCINSDVIRSEKEYQSDCSDDSGHISNENDEVSPSSAISYAVDGSGHNSTNSNGKTLKGTKISELLEKFEPGPKEVVAPVEDASAIAAAAGSAVGRIINKKTCTSVKIAEVKPVKCVRSSLEIYPTYSSEVLFRSGVLSQLEAKRDELLSDRIVQLQAYCRGYLARRRVAQRRVQELAVRCIQRNVKAFLAVRDWPWWRLLVRVTPLLNVHRTEEQLKIANDELQLLRTKLEKIENDRNTLKTEHDKLEAKNVTSLSCHKGEMAPNPPATAISTLQSIAPPALVIKPPATSNRPPIPKAPTTCNKINGIVTTKTKLLTSIPSPEPIVKDIDTSMKNDIDSRRPPVPPQISSRARKPPIPVTRPKLSLAPDPLLKPKGPNQSPIEISLKLPVRKSSSYTDMLNGIYRGPSRDSSIISSRSPSPSTRSSVSSYSSSSYRQQRSITPRRIFPQSYSRENELNLYEMQSLEQSPVVFDANLQFVMGCKRQSVHQAFRPSPSHTDPQTASNYLSAKIANFLKRTDHVNEEWRSMGRRNDHGDDATISLIERQRERSVEKGRLGRSRSATNIIIKGYQLSKTLPPTERSGSAQREMSHDSDRTLNDEELSEMTVDLAEERSASNISTERLEAETAERLKLEKELQEQQTKVKNLQETSEKLEMELICAKSDLNGISEDEDPDNEDSGGVYKLKYERVARELEFTKRRLQTQHEHDLEQLVGLKKQLEKKLADAYEEVEEQRQVVGQWKRKAQKMTNEMNDLRMLLEEQNGRNNLLEKKQRKFDSECQALQDAARLERQSKDRLAREKDVLIAEKFTLEQNLADTRLELDLKEEKLAALQRELSEMTFGGGTEEEVAQLRRSKMDLERRLKEQEEELDEMAGQVQLLEQAKLRLEMTLETMRKEARREAQQRDDELEEARGSAYKKIKALECQLETEHEERTLLLREKHELERRLQSMEDQDRADRAAEEVANQKLRRDLRKYKALLKDAHAQLERHKADSPGKALIRQLRNQLEDAEAARTIAMKSRQSAESELTEVQSMLEEAQRARNDAEDKATAAHRDKQELQAQIEENEEEMAELMKKYSATVKQLNNEHSAMSEYEIRISELETERNSLKEQVAELQTRLENIENMSDPSAAVQSKRLELRAKELESRLELEQATRARLEVQANRHKDALEKVQNEVAQSKLRELQAQDALKKVQKNLRELREEFHMISNREQECITRRKDIEKKLETSEAESASLRNDLRLALQRIADLQQAMEEGDDDVTESEESESSDGSLSELEQRLRPVQVKRTSITTVKDTNGLSDTTLVIREKKSENSPRITVTSPSKANLKLKDDSHKNGDASYA